MKRKVNGRFCDTNQSSDSYLTLLARFASACNDVNVSAPPVTVSTFPCISLFCI